MQHSMVLDNDIDFPERNARQLASRDFVAGLLQWRVWSMLAYQDIKLRYRRSVLGPLWITLSMAITVYTMGFLYAHLFHIELQFYFPFLVGGMVTWALISTQVSDLTETFVLSDSLIKQIKLPYSLYVHRVVARNFFIFFHNVVVILPVILVFHETAKININTLFIFPALLLLYMASFVYGMTLAMLGARYRDISQVIKSVIQIIFFLTPIMWRPETLSPQKQFIVYLNPFSAFVEMIRAPLIGELPTLYQLSVVCAMIFVGAAISAVLFVRYRSRIVYWL